MSRIVTIVSPREGVGKTTTALNIAQAFALGGQGALLLDFDDKGDVSSQLSVARPQTGVLERVLAGEEQVSSIGLLVRSVVAGLDLIPSDIGTENVILAPDAHIHLQAALRELRFQYPWCVIDCPSALNSWTTAALCVADTVVIPVEAELFAKESTAEILTFIRDVREPLADKDVSIRILMTRFRDRNSLSADVRRDLDFEYPELFSPTVIPRDEKVRESQSAKQTLLQYSLESRAARAYVQFAKEVMTHGRKKTW